MLSGIRELDLTQRLVEGEVTKSQNARLFVTVGL
jgi:hypothetical protein